MITMTKRNYPTNETLTRDISIFLYLDKEGLCLAHITADMSAQQLVDKLKNDKIPDFIVDMAMKYDDFEQCEIWSTRVNESMYNNMSQSIKSTDPIFVEFTTHMEKYGMSVPIKIDRQIISYELLCSFVNPLPPTMSVHFR